MAVIYTVPMIAARSTDGGRPLISAYSQISNNGNSRYVAQRRPITPTATAMAIAINAPTCRPEIARR